MLPMVNSRQCILLRNDRLERQLCLLERSVTAGSGREKIDHPRGAHDDLANSCAGALVIARQRGVIAPIHRLQTHALGASYDPLASPQEQAIAAAREEARAGYFTGPGWAPTWHGDDESLPVGAIN